MSLDMHPGAATSIRSELAAIGTRGSRLQRRQRRARITVSLLAVAAVAVTTSAAALLATGLPGSTATAALGPSTTATHTGPARIEMGGAPAGAGAVIVDLTCLNTAGMVQVPTRSGESGTSCRDLGTVHVVDGLLPAPGTTTFSVDATPGTKWRATVQYASAVTSEWSVNANGQTYGVENASGHPDLVPARADNGRTGWARWDQWSAAEKTATVDVYESDGTTVIGHAEVVVGVDEVPLDRGLIDDLESVQTNEPDPGPSR